MTIEGIWRMISFGGDAVTDKKRIPSDEGRAIVISHSSSDVV
ncbi:MAG: hypothetical protein PHF57_10590 [Methanoregula sp.]|nr:hypothetical protein [Methanoregula sp.]